MAEPVVNFRNPNQYGVETGEFKYNKKYKSENGQFLEDSSVPYKDMGDNAYIYRTHKEATEFRHEKIEDDDGVGGFYGSTTSRSKTLDGDATLSENFVYNGGTTSTTNRPTYFYAGQGDYADATRGEKPYNISGNYNVNTFRNEVEVS